MTNLNDATRQRIPWNKGKLIGQKPPLKLNVVMPFVLGSSWQKGYAI